MAFWSGEALLQNLPNLVNPFDPNQIDCAAYTLRVGAEVYVTPSMAEQNPDQISIRHLATGEAFTIPAGQFAFLLTQEKIKAPDNAIAFISMKSSVKLRGLVNVSGFHVDPGYNGNLVFAVFNAGPRPIHLRRGDDCFLIWYADLDRHSKQTKTMPGHQSITTALVTDISGQVMSFDGLNAKIKELKEDYDEKIHAIQRDHTIIRTGGTLIVGILVTAILIPYIRTAWDWWQHPLPTVSSEPQIRIPPIAPTTSNPPSTPPQQAAPIPVPAPPANPGK
jgi:dCTP deaminase